MKSIRLTLKRNEELRTVEFYSTHTALEYIDWMKGSGYVLIDWESIGAL